MYIVCQRLCLCGHEHSSDLLIRFNSFRWVSAGTESKAIHGSSLPRETLVCRTAEFVTCTTRILFSCAEENSGDIGLPVLHILHGDAENHSQPPLWASLRAKRHLLHILQLPLVSWDQFKIPALCYPLSSKISHSCCSKLYSWALRLPWSPPHPNTSPRWRTVPWGTDLIFSHFILPVPRLLLSTGMYDFYWW